MMLDYCAINHQRIQEQQKLIEERPTGKMARINLNLFG
jgi:hypothetical protein